MASEWPIVRLGDLLEIRHGWPFKSQLFNEELTGLPIVINVGNFQYTGGFRFESTTLKEYRGVYPRQFELTPGAILLVMTCQTPGGEILGIPARIPDDGRVYLHNQRLGKVVVNSPASVDVGYLYWLFLWPEFNRELLSTATGTKILHTAPSRIEAFRFRLPGLREQQAIARILTAVGDKIELNRRMNATLEAMARALFKSWFVDFDPVHAKAEGGDTGLPKQVADLFPDRFEDSELGQVPLGWRSGALGEIANNSRDTVRPRQIGTASPYIGLEHMPRGSIALDQWENAEHLESGKFRFQRRDILFGKLRPYFHKVGVAPLDGVCSTDILVINPDDPEWFGLLLGHASGKPFVDYCDAASTGTKMPRTNWGDMGRFPIAVPPKPLAAAFTRLVGPMVEKVIAGIHESHTLAALRDVLLPKLISGELRVPDAERFVERATALA